MHPSQNIRRAHPTLLTQLQISSVSRLGHLGVHSQPLWTSSSSSIKREQKCLSQVYGNETGTRGTRPSAVAAVNSVLCLPLVCPVSVNGPWCTPPLHI